MEPPYERPSGAVETTTITKHFYSFNTTVNISVSYIISLKILVRLSYIANFFVRYLLPRPI